MAAEPAPKRRRATYVDLEAVPEHLVAEIIDGELITSPRPAPRHAHTSSRLGMKLGGPFDLGESGPGGWVILDEPELHLGYGPDILVPDLAGWRRERMPRIPDGVGITVPPDWVCEVLSPSTTRIDRIRKMPIYARERVRHIWLVDPIAHTLEVFRLEEERWIVAAVHGGDDVVRAEPFDALALALAVLWGV
jgi:Uma2 family endonuclease